MKNKSKKRFKIIGLALLILIIGFFGLYYGVYQSILTGGNKISCVVGSNDWVCSPVGLASIQGSFNKIRFTISEPSNYDNYINGLDSTTFMVTGTGCNQSSALSDWQKTCKRTFRDNVGAGKVILNGTKITGESFSVMGLCNPWDRGEELCYVDDPYPDCSTTEECSLAVVSLNIYFKQGGYTEDDLYSGVITNLTTPQTQDNLVNNTSPDTPNIPDEDLTTTPRENIKKASNYLFYLIPLVIIILIIIIVVSLIRKRKYGK